MKFEHVIKHGRNIRVHPNGFIQIDMPDNQRIHIWTDRLPDRPKSEHPIHNHSFSLISYILHGGMTNVVMTERGTVSDDNPEYPYMGDDPVQLYTRWQAQRLDGEDTKLVQLDEPPICISKKSIYYSAGQEYYLHKDEIHESISDPDTITILQKATFFNLPPTVFVPIGVEPLNSYTRYAYDPKHLWNITEDVFSVYE